MRVLTPSSNRAQACTELVRSLIALEIAQTGAGYPIQETIEAGRWDLNPRQLAWEAVLGENTIPPYAIAYNGRPKPINGFVACCCFLFLPLVHPHRDLFRIVTV